MNTDFPLTIDHNRCPMCQESKRYGHLTCNLCFVSNSLQRMTDEQKQFFQSFEKGLERKRDAQMTLGELVAIAKERGNTREFSNL